MDTIRIMSNPSLEEQRDQILQQMRSLDRIRSGSLSQQYFNKKTGGKVTRQGPYYVLQRYFKGKKYSERVPADQVDQVAEDVKNHERFKELAERFVALTEQITRMADDSTCGKKNSKSRRSARNASVKPKHS